MVKIYIIMHYVVICKYPALKEIINEKSTYPKDSEQVLNSLFFLVSLLLGLHLAHLNHKISQMDWQVSILFPDSFNLQQAVCLAAK